MLHSTEPGVSHSLLKKCDLNGPRVSYTKKKENEDEMIRKYAEIAGKSED